MIVIRRNAPTRASLPAKEGRYLALTIRRPLFFASARHKMRAKICAPLATFIFARRTAVLPARSAASKFRMRSPSLTEPTAPYRNFLLTQSPR
jgi:hypothetical protein